jgi:hypothetical protein
MVSAPGGTTPPVKIRAASPARTSPANGRDLADELQRGRHLRHIGGAHRIAVHRRHVGRRLGAQRRHVSGEHAAFGFDEGCVLARQRLDAIEHAGERVSDQQQ